MLITPALKQEFCKLEARLGYTVRLVKKGERRWRGWDLREGFRLMKSYLHRVIKQATPVWWLGCE